MPSNLASFTDYIWKPGYFNKSHNPKSKHLNFLEGNREKQKYTANEKEESQQCRVFC